MTEEEIETWKAEMIAATRKFGGPPLTEKQIEDLRRRLYGDSDAVTKKYPGTNGCEMALLTEKGEIEIMFSSTADGTSSHGSRTYAPDHKDFQYFWKRHDFDNQKTKTHVIMKRFDEESKEWIDLGQDWIGV
jgi:hypothetical protein